jgi:hypothetical protein
MSPKAVVLIPIYNHTYFRASLKVAKLISESYQAILTFPSPDCKITERQREEIAKHGIEQISEVHYPSAIASKVLIPLLRLFFLGRVFLEIQRVIKLRRFLSGIFATRSIVLVLMPADNRYDYPHITRFSREKKVPVSLFPSWFADELEIIKTFSETPAYTRGLVCSPLKLFLRRHLRSVEVLPGRSRLMIPFSKEEILCRRIFDAEVPQPWLLHSGGADLILVESKAAMEFARSLGFSEDKLALTGSIFLDEMHEIRGSYLERSRNDTSNSLKILTALPPDMFAYPVSHGSSFIDYNHFVEYWCQSVDNVPNSEVTVCLHPSASPEVQKKVEGFGLKVSSSETHELIASTDLYVASISATIQWAIAAGVPTINYDAYHYSYSDYEGIELVHRANTKNEFEALLLGARNIVNKNRYSGQPFGALGTIAELDGEAGARILKKIQGLINSSEDKHK